MEIALSVSIPPPFEPALQLVDLPMAAAIGLAFIVSIALWNKGFATPESRAPSQNREYTYNPNRFLALFLFLIGYDGIETLIISRGYFYALPELFIPFALPRVLLYGPLIYFYVWTLVNPVPIKFSKTHLLHLLPFVIVLLMQLPFTLMTNSDSKVLITYQDIYLLLDVYEANLGGTGETYGSLLLQGAGVSQTIRIDNVYGVLFVYFSILNINNYIEVASAWSYMIACIVILRRHQKMLGQITSTIDGVELRWMVNLLTILLAGFVLFSLNRFIDISGSFQEYLFLQRSTIDALIIFMLFYIGLKALKQPEIFSPELRIGFVAVSSGSGGTNVEPAETNRIVGQNYEQKNKYRSSNLTPEQSTMLAEDILGYMQTEKPFLDSELTLVELARQLDLSSHSLSQILNETLGKNFFDFINGYRIEAVKSRLESDTDNSESILQIAMDSGFNSKSAFYNFFKKEVGMSPSQWRKKQQH